MSFQLEWKVIKKREIEEKLQKLGVEPGTGNGVPQIHARAASVCPFFCMAVDRLLSNLVRADTDIISSGLCTALLEVESVAEVTEWFSF